MIKVQNEKERVNRTLQSVSKLLSNNISAPVEDSLGKGIQIMKRIVKEDALEEVKARIEALKEAKYPKKRLSQTATKEVN